MKTPRPTREQLITLAKNEPETIADLVLSLLDRIDILEAKMAALERNSRTSSKPPSTDATNFTNKPKPKSRRIKTDRKPGGQHGHDGHTLEQSDTPDHIIEHPFTKSDSCPSCGLAVSPNQLANTSDYEARQVFDLPPIQIEITEHRAHKCKCSGCGNPLKAHFPDGITAPVQYGPRVQATAIYLSHYQLLPYERLSESMADLFSCSLSQGTLANIIKRAAQKAQKTDRHITEALRNSPIIHSDETGSRLNGKLHWLHVTCTNTLTSYHFDSKRGACAMERMRILPGYTGSVIHDFWKPYYRFEDCSHYLCNAHLLRELTYLHEQHDQTWAAEMIEVLLEGKRLAESALEEASTISKRNKIRIYEAYENTVNKGLTENPEPQPVPGRRGRPKRSKTLNLLRRLENRYAEIMGFFEELGIPFDNNQAERDVRMTKVHAKISGGFRSEEHAKGFCAIRGVISTARKQSHSMIKSLTNLLSDPEELGRTLAS